MNLSDKFQVPGSATRPSSSDPSGRWAARNVGGKADVGVRSLTTFVLLAYSAAVQRELPFAVELPIHCCYHA